ncbi:methylmalonyl-CoA carboxyltransferase [Sesbania bispinosa]|nr:methylmalonyl-CoA carboxyltransferase [Sesbania bispinosa]
MRIVTQGVVEKEGTLQRHRMPAMEVAMVGREVPPGGCVTRKLTTDWWIPKP